MRIDLKLIYSEKNMIKILNNKKDKTFKSYLFYFAQRNQTFSNIESLFNHKSIEYIQVLSPSHDDQPRTSTFDDVQFHLYICPIQLSVSKFCFGQ